MKPAAISPADLRASLMAMPIEALVDFAVRGARAQQAIDNIRRALPPTERDERMLKGLLEADAVQARLQRAFDRNSAPSPTSGVITGWKKANGQPGAFCQECGAQDGTVLQHRCKACRDSAPATSVPRSRLNQSKNGVPLNARGTPRPACTGCGARNGLVRMGRCEECRKKGKGKIVTGRRYPKPRKASPPLPYRKPRKALRALGKKMKAEVEQIAAPAPPAKSGPVSDAWIAAFKARAAVQPKLLTSWGAGPIVKLLAAGGRPFYEKLPPTIRKEVAE